MPPLDQGQTRLPLPAPVPFRPVPPATPRPAALPSPLTSLVGREAEIAAVSALLDDDVIRLLTLTGPGGVGKTRLAIAVTTAIEPRYAHSAAFVRLAAIRDPALVPAAVAHALGILDGNRPSEQAVIDVLRDQHLLLVLDNLEHLPPAALWLAELLDACRRLTLLVTSRVPLQIAGEQRYPVPPLSVPPAEGQIDLSRADGYSAPRLFTARARAVVPDFALDEANIVAIAAICRRLDGLPLALELAAARIGVFAPDELADRLDQSLPLLTGGPRDAPARLQSMRGAIAWSYELLPEDERAFFRWLSVFVGGFALDEAEGIAAALGHDPSWTLGAVTSLVEQCLLRRLPGDERRFAMLETIREFGQEQLGRCGEVAPARAAHAEALLALIAEAEREGLGPMQIAWLDRLEAEQGNARAAFAWLAQRGEVARAGDAAASLWFFWWVRGYLSEGQRVLETLLAQPGLGERTISRARVLNALAVLCNARSDRVRALMLHDEALAIFRERDDRAGIAWVLGCLHRPLENGHDLAAAEARTEEALALYQDLADERQVVRMRRLLGHLAMHRGDVARAARLLEESRVQARALGDLWSVARASFELAMLASEWSTSDENLASAQRLMDEALQLNRAYGTRFQLPYALIVAGDLCRRRGDLPGAACLFDEAHALAVRSGDRTMIAWALGHRAGIVRRQGAPGEALTLLTEALETELGTDARSKLPDLLHELAALARDRRQLERAARLLGAASRLRTARHEIVPARRQAEDDAERNGVERALDAAAFARAWEAGHAMTEADLLDEAIAMRAALPAKPESAAATGLSARELDILQRVAAGLSNQQIADQLFVSVRTVTSHITSIHTKLGVDSRTAAVAYALRAGLV